MKTTQTHRSYLLYIACLLLTNCTTNQSNTNLSIHNLTTLPIEFREPLPLNRFIDRTELIPLEQTDPLIGNIDQLIFTKDRIIVADKRNAALFLFDTTGRTKAVITRQGRGPLEYLTLDHIALTADGKQIALHDNTGKKVCFFNLEGDFIETKSVDFWFAEFEYLDPKRILCTTYGASNDPGLMEAGIPGYTVYITDPDFNIEKGLLPNRYTSEGYMHATPHLRKFGNELFLNPNFCDTLYSISGDTLQALYHMNLSKVGGIANFAPETTNDQITEALAHRTTFPGLFAVNDRFILLKVSTPEANRPMLWSKESRTLYTLTNDIRVNMQGACGPFDFHLTACSFGDGERFIAALPAYMLNMGSYTEELLDKYPQLRGLTDDSNPVLITYRLKEPSTIEK